MSALRAIAGCVEMAAKFDELLDLIHPIG